MVPDVPLLEKELGCEPGPSGDTSCSSPFLAKKSRGDSGNEGVTPVMFSLSSDLRRRLDVGDGEILGWKINRFPPFGVEVHDIGLSQQGIYGLYLDWYGLLKDFCIVFFVGIRNWIISYNKGDIVSRSWIGANFDVYRRGEERDPECVYWSKDGHSFHVMGKSIGAISGRNLVGCN